MTAWLDKDGVLHVCSESVYEALALKAWQQQNTVQNVNGVNLMPSRHFVTHAETAKT